MTSPQDHDADVMRNAEPGLLRIRPKDRGLVRTIAMPRSEWATCAAAMAAGIGVIEFAIVSVTPLRVDWDWFNSGGMVTLCLIAAALGFLEPRHPWRWGFLPIAAIPAWMLVRGGSLGNMWPIFLLSFAAAAIPPMIAAWIGAWLRTP
jgi:hypothetical protein